MSIDSSIPASLGSSEDWKRGRRGFSGRKGRRSARRCAMVGRSYRMRMLNLSSLQEIRCMPNVPGRQGLQSVRLELLFQNIEHLRKAPRIQTALSHGATACHRAVRTCQAAQHLQVPQGFLATQILVLFKGSWTEDSLNQASKHRHPPHRTRSTDCGGRSEKLSAYKVILSRQG